jgi:hypothetical protein
MPEFKEREANRRQRKEEDLAPYIEAAMARKNYMKPLTDDEIPTFSALGRRIVEETDEETSIMKKESH